MEIKEKWRIGLVGIYHESNTFITRKTTMEDFRNSHLLRGMEIVQEYQAAYHEIGGMLEVMAMEEVEVIPLLFAEATPGGMVTAETYQEIWSEIDDLISKNLPLDGCLVVPHGAAVSEKFPDMDGKWLFELRKILGPDVPIIGTIDPHANVSETMVQATDALVAYRTNPHVDQRETGKLAGRLMLDTLQRKIKPVQWLIKPPVTISIEQQYTNEYPCTLLYAKARADMEMDKVLVVNIVLGFPYADVQEMGTSFLVVTDDNMTLAKDIGNSLEDLLFENRYDFVRKLEPIDKQLDAIELAEKPVLWLDMGDNVGGGSLGDSVVLLKELEHRQWVRGFACIFAPDTVQELSNAVLGDEILVNIGHDYRMVGKQYPITVRGRIVKKVDGKFNESNPRHGGQVNFDMGNTLLLESEGNDLIMLHSLRIPPFSLSQLTSFGIDPLDFDVLVAKGVNAPIAAYGPVCKTILQANTPGATQAEITKMTYHFRPKPLFPFEDNF